MCLQFLGEPVQESVVQGLLSSHSTSLEQRFSGGVGVGVRGGEGEGVAVSVAFGVAVASGVGVVLGTALIDTFADKPGTALQTRIPRFAFGAVRVVPSSTTTSSFKTPSET